jgi:hypothetical protein
MVVRTRWVKIVGSDIRRFPTEEARAIEEEIGRLSGGPSAATEHGNATRTAYGWNYGERCHV